MRLGSLSSAFLRAARLKRSLLVAFACTIAVSGGGLLAARSAEAAPSSVEVGGFVVVGGQEGVDYEFKSITMMSQGREVAQDSASYKGSDLSESGEPFTVLQNDPYLVIKTSAPLEISNVDAAAPNPTGIFVEGGVKANLTFSNVNIAAKAPVYIETNSKNTAENANLATMDESEIPEGERTALNLILADGSTNRLVVSPMTSQFPAIRCGEGSDLTIDDGVVNKDTSGTAITPENGRIPAGTEYVNRLGQVVTAGYDSNDALTYLESSNPGSLEAQGGDRSAGIGSAPIEEAGRMTFNGGVITAFSNGTGAPGGLNAQMTGSAIGGGQCGGNTTLTINGGEIYATATYHGAGIGGGATGGGGLGGRAYVAPDAILGRCPAHPIAGDIIINGGYIESAGGVHGNGFGAACWGTLQGETILITGGTLLPSSQSGFYDVGGEGGDVIITGGSVKTTVDGSKFQGNAGLGKAYGDYSIVDGEIVPDADNIVQMVQIDLSGYGEGAKGAYITNLNMSVAGVGRDYGLPSRTDENGMLYLWIGSSAGKEVSIDLGIESSETGEALPTDTFFVPGDKNKPGALLKQYYPFEVSRDQIGLDLLDKRYDGLNFDVSSLYDTFGTEDGKVSIPVDNPPDGSINDPKYMTIASQLLQRTWEGEISEWPAAPNAPIIQSSDEDPEQTNSNVGKYQAIITSTQYANVGGDFGNSFYGHRAYAKYIEISPAESRVSLASDPVSGPADEAFTLTATVRPAEGEAKTCKAPEGLLQFYINGEPSGDPVELDPALDASGQGELVDADGWHYATASLTWTPGSTGSVGDVGENGSLGEVEVTARYIGRDSQEASDAYLDAYQINYNESATLEPLSLDIDPVEPAAPGDGGLGFEVHLQGEDGEDQGPIPNNHLTAALEDGGVDLGGYLVDEDGSIETGSHFEIVDEEGNPVESGVAEVDPVTGKVTFHTGGTVYVKVTRPGDAVLVESSVVIEIDIFDQASIIVKRDPSSASAFAWGDVNVGEPIVDELGRLDAGVAEQWAQDLAGQLGLDFVGWTLDPETNVILGPNDLLPNGPTTVYPVFGEKADTDGVDAGETGSVSIDKAVENTTSEDGKNRPGDILRYTVSAKNNGPEEWRDVDIVDHLPANCALVDTSVRLIVIDDGGQRTESSLSAGDYTCDGNTLGYKVPVIDAGWTYLLQFDVTIQMDAVTAGEQGAVIENAASVVGADEDGAITGGGTDPVFPGEDGTVTPNDPGRTIGKAVSSLSDPDGERTQVGDRVRYEITVSNTAAWSIWEDAALYDQLPRGIEPDAASFALTLPDGSEIGVPAGAYDSEARVLYVVVGDLAYGERAVFTFEATVTEDALGADIGNVAWAGDGGVTGEGGPGEDGKPENAVDSGDPVRPLPGDSADEEGGVMPADPDPILSKTVDDTTPDNGYQVDDVLVYRIVLSNGVAGSVWRDAVIVDELPEGLTLETGVVEVELPDGTKEEIDLGRDTRTITVEVGDIWGGEECAVTYRCVLSVPGDGASEIVNGVTASGVTPDDPLAADPTAQVSIPSPAVAADGGATDGFLPGGLLPSTGDVSVVAPALLAASGAVALAAVARRRR